MALGFSPRCATVGLLCIALVLTTTYYVNVHALYLVFSLVDFFKTRSLKACIVYVFIYDIVSLVSLPLMPLEIFTGYCFGVRFGILLDIMGRVSGAVTSFLIARSVLRAGGERACCSKVRSHAFLKGVGAAVQDRGLRFLILFNLAPLPLAVKNYGLGFVPEVGLLSFVTAIFIIEIPLASIWAWMGSEAAAEVASMQTNVTMTAENVGKIIRARMHQENYYLKVGLPAIGICAFLLVMHTLHNFVGKELAKVSTKLEDPCEATVDQSA